MRGINFDKDKIDLFWFVICKNFLLWGYLSLFYDISIEKLFLVYFLLDL